MERNSIFSIFYVELWQVEWNLSPKFPSKHTSRELKGGNVHRNKSEFILGWTAYAAAKGLTSKYVESELDHKDEVNIYEVRGTIPK